MFCPVTVMLNFQVFLAVMTPMLALLSCMRAMLCQDITNCFSCLGSKVNS